MRVSGIHLRGHSNLPDGSWTFKDSEGRLLDVACLEGLCGSGKSLLLDLVCHAWGYSVRSRPRSRTFDLDLCRVDFDINNEIVSVHVRRDHVEGNNRLATCFDSGQVLLKYDLSLLSSGISGTESSGVQSIFPIISDIHLQGFRDSVILIDDFGICLSSTDSLSLFKYLRSHLLSRGNQLIFTCRESSMFGLEHCFRLPGGINPLERSLKLLKK